MGVDGQFNGPIGKIEGANGVAQVSWKWLFSRPWSILATRY